MLLPYVNPSPAPITHALITHWLSSSNKTFSIPPTYTFTMYLENYFSDVTWLLESVEIFFFGCLLVSCFAVLKVLKFNFAISIKTFSSCPQDRREESQQRVGGGVPSHHRESAEHGPADLRCRP